jgi:hypothetical protein
MEPREIQGEIFGPVGRCIYCGVNGNDAKLESEHIMPFNLGGDAELLEASCRACAGATSYLDGYLGKNSFYEYRVHVGIQTRRPKERPDVLPARIEYLDRIETTTYPIADHPFFTILPLFGRAGFLQGEPATETFPVWKAVSYHHFPDNLSETFRLQLGETARIHAGGTINLPTFARAIAKIAYCHAVIEFGLDGFRPLWMPDLILGRYHCVPFLVGSDVDDPPPPDRETLRHSVNFVNWEGERLRVIVANVRLFANSGTDAHGMPIYHVVVGVHGNRKSIPVRRLPTRHRVIAL